MQKWIVSSTSRETVAFDRGLNLDDLLFHYGVRINQDLVEDMQCASINLVVGKQGGKPQFQLLPWPYYPLLDGSPFSLITKNLDPVLSKFTNSIDTVKAAGYFENHFTADFSQCKNRFHSGPDFAWKRSKQPAIPKLFQQSHIPVGVVLEGKFQSLYANRISAAMSRQFCAGVYNQPFLKSGIKDARDYCLCRWRSRDE